jgi:vacuolar-type H+-ATPase subunit F/Vma7
MISVVGVQMKSTTTDLGIANSTPVAHAETVEMLEKAEATSTIEITKNLNEGLKEKIMETFKDEPLLVQIAKCESGYRQYDSKGNILRGIVNNKDVGIMQINEGYHLERAKELGIDIYSVDGNLAYAKLMYHEQGGMPWKASSPCWSAVAYR